MKQTILFDTETTGLLVPEINELSAQPYIVDFYAVKIDDDFNIIDEFESYIKPPIPIPPDLTKIHGVSNDTVKNSPTFEQLYPRLAEFFLGANKLVGHNVAFDRSMLANELLRCDMLLKFPWPPEHICTVEMSMHIEQRRMKLSDLHAHCTGKPHADAHRAKSDVFALVRCYHWLLESPTTPDKFKR